MGKSDDWRLSDESLAKIEREVAAFVPTPVRYELDIRKATRLVSNDSRIVQLSEPEYWVAVREAAEKIERIEVYDPPRTAEGYRVGRERYYLIEETRAELAAARAHARAKIAAVIGPKPSRQALKQYWATRRSTMFYMFTGGMKIKEIAAKFEISGTAVRFQIKREQRIRAAIARRGAVNHAQV